jgi:hypothetical protein
VETMYGPVTVVAYFQGTITQYQLTTSVSPSGGGTVTPSCPSGCSYDSGSQVTITATPASGYQFTGFTGSTNTSSNPLTLTLTSAMTETANFTPIVYQLTTSVNPSGGGTVTPSCPSGCSYNSGSQVTITATPASGYQFSNFTGTTNSSTSPLSFTMTGAANETANFVVTTPNPIVTAFSSNPAPVGTSVTIQGQNFGSTQGTVTFGQTTAAIGSWNATNITATVPTGLAAGALTVTVTTSAGAGTNTFTVNPGISGLSPNPLTPGSPVTITGTSFGATQALSTVTFNGTAATAISTWTDTSLVATVPSGTVAGSVVVTVNNTASAGTAYTVTTPQNYTISGTVTIGSCPLAGVTVSLTGVPSTTTNSSGAYSFTVAGGANYTLTPSLTDYTFTPASFTVNNLSSNQQRNFTASGPAIPSREYIRLGGRIIAVANCGSQ